MRCGCNLNAGEVLGKIKRDQAMIRISSSFNPMTSPKDIPPEKETSFSEQADTPELGWLAEFWLFLKENKKWWLIPLLGSLLLLGVVSWFAASGAAPFIYTLF